MKCEATKAMENARAGLVSKHPSLGYLCFKLKWFPDSTCPTAWTDGVSVGFNPDFVLSLKNAGRQFLAAHEVAHPMFGHHLRRGDRDAGKWNIACDHVVNLILVKQGFNLLKNALLDYSFEGMAVEQVFNVLFPPGQEDQEKDQDSTESGQNDDSSPSEDEEASEGQEGSEDDSEGGTGDDSSSSESSETDSDQTGGPEGKTGQDPGESGDAPEADADDGQPGEVPGSDSGEASEERSNEGISPEDAGCGEVRDFPGETSEDFDMEAEKWDLAIQQAAQMERKLSPEGDLPGFVETILDGISNPKLPWTEILSRWLTSKAKNDYTWNKPNTRYSASGIFLPSLESQELGKVAIFWDTSCSVTDAQAQDIGAETQGILTHFPGVLIDLYHIDTKVQDIEEIDQYTDWDLVTAKGRGGTDFRPGFYAIEDDGEEDPVGVVYMTDGECSKFPEDDPPYPVLWIVVDMPRDFRFEPPFGEVAYYNDF